MVGPPPFAPKEQEFYAGDPEEMGIEEKVFRPDRPLKRPEGFAGGSSTDVSDVSDHADGRVRLALSPIGSPDTTGGCGLWRNFDRTKCFSVAAKVLQPHSVLNEPARRNVVMEKKTEDQYKALSEGQTPQ
jgi:hypothetical protein